MQGGFDSLWRCVIRNINYRDALDLRLRGKTYGEIRKALGIAKSTQSGWFKNIKLTGRAAKVLKTKQGENMKFLAGFNKLRSQNIALENEGIRSRYEALIGNLNKRDLMLIGAVLYWGEGQKVFNNKTGYKNVYINFSNSDPFMVLSFIKFLDDILGIDKNKLWASVMIHPNTPEKPAVNYWQKLTKIPMERLRCYRALSTASRGKRPKNLLPYGTFQIRVNKRREFYKVRGLMDGIIKATINEK